MDVKLTCNTPNEDLFGAVAINSRRDLPWVRSEGAREGHACLVGGGPSLADTLPSLERRIRLGQTVFALNGAAKYLNDHGIVPDHQVILDARPENAHLIGRARNYLLASQVHPNVFDAVPAKHTMLWHHATEGITSHVPDLDEFYIGGSHSVGLASMCLVYAMGYRNLHLYGYDSSHRATTGHAYAQQNDGVYEYAFNGKTFLTTLTMASQAELFPEIADALIDAGCIITVDGDGLIREVVAAMKQPC